MGYILFYLAWIGISIFLFYKLYKVRRSEVGLIMSIISLLTAFWLLMEGLSYADVSDQAIIFFQRAKYISIIPIPPLLIIVSYGMVWMYTPKSKKLLTLLFLIPLLTVFSLASNIFPYVFVSNESVYYQDKVIIYAYDRGLGFFVHIFYSYILLVSNNILLLYRSIRAPKIYRLQSAYLFLGSFLTTFLNILFVFGVLGDGLIDTTPISIVITIIIYYWIAYILPKKLIVLQARNLMIENMSDVILTVDYNHRIIDMNLAARRLVKKTSSLVDPKSDAIDLTGLDFYKFLHSLSFISEEHIRSYQENKPISKFEVVIDGKRRYYDFIIEDLVDDENKNIGLLYIMRDVSEASKNLHNLIQLNEHLQVSDRIINEALEGIVITNHDNKIIRVNDSFVKMSGYDYYELLGEAPSLLKSGRHGKDYYKEMWQSLNETGQWNGEMWNKKKDGDEYPKYMSINAIKDDDGKLTNYIGISTDISEKKKAEEELRTLAYYDVLTGLPNRSYFKLMLESAINRSQKNGYDIALLYIDMDRFKVVNDTFGHSVGDQLLVQIASRFKGCLDKSESISRIGGDEFTLIVEPYNEIINKDTIVDCILEAFSTPFELEGKYFHIFPSIGVAIAPHDGISCEGLMRKADLAMYGAKEKGRNCAVFYSEKLEAKNTDLHELEVKLGKAIKNNDFELYLQPQVSKIKGVEKVVGAEALIRWPQEDGSMISPFRFIDLAEKNGMIFEIGQFVVEDIVRLSHLLVEADIHINLSFNASVKQFLNEDFYLLLKRLMEEDRNKGMNLTMEVTESLMFEEISEASVLLEKIKALGLKIALDDFGTGFSSMNYLNKLPIDYLKIDKSFIDEMDVNSQKNLAHMIISMAKTLGYNVVAEGVEEKDKLDSLYDGRCDVIQGYYYSKPLPVDEFIQFTNDFNQNKYNANR